MGIFFLLVPAGLVRAADNVRERRDFRPRDVLRPYLSGVLIVPAGFIIVLFMPLAFAIALVAIPAIAVVTMALAS